MLSSNRAATLVISRPTGYIVRGRMSISDVITMHTTHNYNTQRAISCCICTIHLALSKNLNKIEYYMSELDIFLMTQKFRILFPARRRVPCLEKNTQEQAKNEQRQLIGKQLQRKKKEMEGSIASSFLYKMKLTNIYIRQQVCPT